MKKSYLWLIIVLVLILVAGVLVFKNKGEANLAPSSGCPKNQFMKHNPQNTYPQGDADQYCNKFKVCSSGTTPCQLSNFEQLTNFETGLIEGYSFNCACPV